MSQRIPRVKVSGLDLPKIVLGYDPFQGFTALYPRPHEKKVIYTNRFLDPSNVVEVISAAVKEGVDALGFKRLGNLVEAVDRIRVRGIDLTLIPMIYQVPLQLKGRKVSSDRIEATILRYRNYIKRETAYSEYILTEEFRNTESERPLVDEELRNLKVDEGELSKMLYWFSDKKCPGLVTTCVEFYALTGKSDLLEQILRVCNSYGFQVCAGSHMSTVFDILETENLRFPAYYATLNKTGFLMLPSRESMLRSLSKIDAPLIAIKPLAGGRIPPREAFDYIFNLKDDVICMVGLSSAKEARETILAAKDSLKCKEV